ncbi:hypothetical protein [Alteriqipengyuania lutimaris]|uniref:17 kDa surface antigen n=1 Tax=Alteriqipengyuania lutimaris TaxID=1538146 RepID=A0A395LMG4_9SPHN|nr:hypothetical protein [Alteriqipengyuania lutimaris]MBB3034429.1 hypothetical protein [Alteriqipengyuania lutimaris]RDS76674.1 hypothetical protein DL238_03015 [Alteriqipengyuania lutimaris]
MRSIILASAAMLGISAAPASAQYYRAPQTYTAPPAYAAPTVQYAPPHYAPPQYAQTLPPLPPTYDRDDWIRDCRVYLRDRRRRGETGGVVGGIIGGAAGAYAGNRLADDGSRLAGSLIGGGIGGLAGVAIGTLIGLAGRDDAKRDCKQWLSHYEQALAAQAINGGGYAYGGDDYGYRGDNYGYAQGGAYAYGGGYSSSQVGAVVVTIEHQHAERYVPVIREEIVEEYYEVEEREVVRERIVHPRPVQPRGDKRIKYIKTK